MMIPLAREPKRNQRLLLLDLDHQQVETNQEERYGQDHHLQVEKALLSFKKLLKN